MNVAQLLVAGAARADDSQPAIVYGGRSLTHPQLVDRVARLSAGLRSIGLGRGDRMVLLMPNAPELVEALWAGFWGGFVTVPLNWHLHPDEVAYVVRHCGASAIVVSPDTVAAVDALPRDVRVLDVGGSYEETLAAAGDPLVDVAPDDPAWLFYTSGTTGRPKGATLSHRNLIAMTLNYYAEIDRVPPGSTFLHAAPLTHGSGLYLLPATGHGATNVISTATRFSPADFLAGIEQHRVTHATFLAPTMLTRLVDAARAGTHDLSSLGSIVVGGAPLYEEDLRAATDTFGPIVAQIYGQGECPMTITAMPPGAPPQLATSCGRAFPGVEVSVLDADGARLGADATGEVAVRGDVVMTGYWADPDATARTVVDGWLHTGDVGHLDADGHLFLTDRAKDVIITGGSNVYPREVEEVLLTHPLVREVAVVGVPDPEWGESVCAFVVAGDGTDAEALVDHCRAHLASFKKPRHVRFVDELPKNAAGKVLKRELRDLR